VINSLGFEYWAGNLLWDELPKEGHIIASMPGHLAAVCDGVIYDTWDCSKKYKRISGYWI